MAVKGQRFALKLKLQNPHVEHGVAIPTRDSREANQLNVASPDLGALKLGDALNLEVDVMARYAARLMETR